MGQDYAARKRAKRRRKGSDIDPELASEGRRKRSKLKAVRRLCQGMCYKTPELTADDHADGKGGTVAAPDFKKRRLHAADNRGSAHASKQPKSQAGAAGGSCSSNCEPHTPARPTLRLSTSVPLMSAGAMVRNVQLAAEQRSGHRHLAQKDLPAALAGLPEPLQAYMLREGFTEPTPVQARCWAACLAGHDVEMTSEPGSGKTLAYLLPVLPALLSVSDDLPPASPAALVLAPTRELAQQIAGACRPLKALFGLSTALCCGGTERGAQAAALRKRSVHILVATPGRLLDLLGAGDLSPGRVRYVAMDEADKMLALGLRPQLDSLRAALLPTPLPLSKRPAGTKGVRAGSTANKKRKRLAAASIVAEGKDVLEEAQITPDASPAAGANLADVPDRKRPQVVLCTATMPGELADVVSQWLIKPERIHVTPSHAAISRSIMQVCAEHKKPAKLLKFLAHVKDQGAGQRNPPRVLVFANRIKTARFVHETVADIGLRVALLHGELSQPEREDAMRAFRSGKAQVLVATDVAARGLHVRGLPYVVNYDFPSNVESYIHRVGRTGRLASAGQAFSFFTRNFAPLARPVLGLLQEHGQAVDPNLVRLAAAYETAQSLVGTSAMPQPSDDERSTAPQPGTVACDSPSQPAGERLSKQRKVVGTVVASETFDGEAVTAGMARADITDRILSSGSESAEGDAGPVRLPFGVPGLYRKLGKQPSGGEGSSSNAEDAEKHAHPSNEAMGRLGQGQQGHAQSQQGSPTSRQKFRRLRALPGRLRAKVAKQRTRQQEGSKF